MIILYKGAEASFKTNTILARKSYHNLLKPTGLQKGPLLPLFRRPVKITATFDVTMIYAVGAI